MDVLAIFQRVTRVLPSRLVMIGDGPDRSRAESFVREHHLREKVFFLGNVPNLEEIVGASDLFLLPSEAESFGMAALEAMASEVPVIATSAGGLPEVVEDGISGYLRAPDDVEGMAAAATAILQDPVQHAAFARAGLERVRRHFCAGRVVPQYEEYYREVIQS
jgi:N-acetyl-alpha-D-glucosaminyl L-malate synthase BshA